MAETRYLRDQPTSLQSLLDMSVLQPDAPVGAPTPPQAPQVETQGILSPQDRQKLMEMLLQPEDPGPAPQVDKPSALAMIFSGLGDAVNAFAANKHGGIMSNYFDQYQAKLNQQKADALRYEQNKAKSDRESKRRTANYILDRDEAMQEQQLSAMAKAAADERADRIRQEDIARKDAEIARGIATSQEALAEQRRRREEDHKWDLELEAFRQSHKDPDEKKAKSAEKEQQNYAKGVQLALLLRDGDKTQGVKSVRDYLAEGADPGVLAGQLRQKYEEELDAEGVFGKARDLARNFFNRKMIEALQGAIQQGP